MGETYRIEWVSPDWERFGHVLDMIYAVLYRDFGVPVEYDWYSVDGSATGVAINTDPSEIVVVLSANGRHILGAARLMGPAGAKQRRLRQVAVEPAMQGAGVGRALMEAVERKAAEEGACELWFNARDSAWGFYARLGYLPEGDVFVSQLTQIPHRRFRKRIC